MKLEPHWLATAPQLYENAAVTAPWFLPFIGAYYRFLDWRQ